MNPTQHAHRHPHPRDLPPAKGLEWLAAGWRTFLKSPGVWIAQALVFVLVFLALGSVPGVGPVIVMVCFPILAAGMVASAQRLEAGEAIGIGHLFEGLRRHTANLVMVGVFYLLGGLFAGLIATAIGGNAMLTGYILGALSGVGLAVGGLVVTTMVFIPLLVMLVSALWFAPALVLLHDVAPLEAMRLSVNACIHNLPSFGLLAVMLYALIWLAMLAAGLGSATFLLLALMLALLPFLVLVPVIAGALFASYRDTFGETPAPAGEN